MAVKGKTNNPNGRPKGVPNRSTTELRIAVTNLIESNWDRIQGDLDALDPKDRLMFIEKMLSYSLPKLTAVTQETILRSTLEQLSETELHKVAEMILNNNQKEYE